MDELLALKVDGLVAGYGRTKIVDGLSFEVGRGQIIGLLGRNGVGKTTTLKALMGHLPHQGTVHLGSRDISGLKPYERAASGLAYVPQGRRIFGPLSVEDNLRIAVSRKSRGTWRQDVDRLYEQFPVLGEKRRQPGGQLSGGQQQILALARALIARPSVMLLDEPSEGIQPSIVDQIGETLDALRNDAGMSFVLVEQNLGFATSVCDSVTVIDKGRVVLSVAPQELAADRDLQHKFLGV